MTSVLRMNDNDKNIMVEHDIRIMVNSVQELRVFRAWPEHRPFAFKNSKNKKKNVVGAPDVTLAKKKIDTQPKQFLFKKWNLHSLVYILNKFESLKVVVKRQVCR